jgi:sucrose phosphorylase
MFLTYSRVFPQGACESDLLALSTPRPTLPFTTHTNARGEHILLWTTFTSDQIDIDLRDPEARRYLTGILTRLHAAKVQAIRLDAIGYAIKQPGTSCFMIPETRAFIDDITAQTHALEMEVLVEVHGHYQTQVDVARQVDWVYDFALPALVLHALYTRDATPLRRWLEIRPHNAITVLDTHDGIGVADAGGLLAQDALDALIETIHLRSRGESRLASGGAARNVDASQINCTFYDALGRRDSEYLVARAIQCFVPGIPQIYYVGLLAGTNDLDLLRRTGEGRDINRHYFTPIELQRALAQPVVQSLLALLRIRNTHAAFQGAFHVKAADAMRLALVWEQGTAFARLDVDLAEMEAAVTCSAEGASATTLAWCSTNGATQGEAR